LDYKNTMSVGNELALHASNDVNPDQSMKLNWRTATLMLNVFGLLMFLGWQGSPFDGLQNMNESSLRKVSHSSIHQKSFEMDAGESSTTLREEFATSDFGTSRQLQEEEVSNAIPTNKKAFVCITGQLGRLELENKIRTLIDPLHRHGYEIGLALVLSKGTPTFTHAFMKEQRYASEREMLDVFRYHPNVKILNSPHSLYDPMPDPNPPAVYFVNMKKHDDRDLDKVFQRAENHVRQYDSYRRCWDIERSTAPPHGPGEPVPPQYDVYIRIRDDVGFEKNLNMTLVNTFTAIARKRNNKAIMVSDCRSFGGVNDRLAIVTPAAAEDYFLNPYKLIKEDPYAKFGARGNEVDWKRVINPESLLRNVYEASDIKIIQSKYIRGVDRIVMKRKGTEMIDAFHFMDETQPFCPEIDED